MPVEQLLNVENVEVERNEKGSILHYSNGFNNSSIFMGFCNNNIDGS
jgi:hypothetical protein